LVAVQKYLSKHTVRKRWLKGKPQMVKDPQLAIGGLDLTLNIKILNRTPFSAKRRTDIKMKSDALISPQRIRITCEGSGDVMETPGKFSSNRCGKKRKARVCTLSEVAGRWKVQKKRLTSF